MTAAKHILMTADAVGGVWTYALDLARGLGARGMRVSLAVLGPPPSAEQRQQAAALENVRVHEHPGRLEWMDDPWADVDDAGAWLLALERELQPDVVHLNGYAHGALPWSAPLIIVGHSCVLSWWRAVRGDDAPPSWSRYAREVTRGVRAASMVIAPSAAMLSALDTHYGPLPRTRVIRNGRFAPAIHTVAKEPFVLTAGRLWDEAKNVATVCAVAPRLPWPVYVAGETRQPGRDSENSEARLQTGESDGCHYLGRLTSPGLASWMARASIYALPARYEPFGLSALEAALAGCPLVLGDIRSLREIWGDAAIYVSPDNQSMLVSAIRRLAADDTLRAEMAARAACRAQSLDGPRMANEYCDAYQELTREVRPLLSLSAV